MALQVIKRVKNAVLYAGGVIKINNVRASYPHLARAYSGEDGGAAKFGIVGIAAKTTHKEAALLIKEAIDDLLAANKGAKVAKDKRCLKNGDDSDKEEYEGAYTIHASETKRPKVRDADNSEMEREDIEEIIYAGCHVDLGIRLWFQDNKYGKRVNANLVSVRFRKDGEAIGEGRIDDSDLWDDEEDDNDDDDDI